MKQVVVVTGGASGIGRACCLALAEAGTQVVSVDVTAQSDWGSIRSFVADVSDPKGVHDVMEYATGLGDLHGLVANAGCYPRIAFDELTLDRWNEILRINLTASFLCAREFCCRCAPTGASIVCIGSILARIPRRELLPYIAAKAGLEGFVRALALELSEREIRVNCVVPGSISVNRESEIADDLEEMETRQLARQCLKRRGKPSDVAKLVQFLLGPRAGFITGECIGVTGGWFAYEC